MTVLRLIRAGRSALEAMFCQAVVIVEVAGRCKETA
jgi:hypothetical protein